MMDASAVAQLTAEDLALIGIDPQSIAVAFSWGFGTVVTFWATGFVIGIAIRLIRKI